MRQSSRWTNGGWTTKLGSLRYQSLSDLSQQFANLLQSQTISRLFCTRNTSTCLLHSIRSSLLLPKLLWRMLVLYSRTILCRRITMYPRRTKLRLCSLVLSVILNCVCVCVCGEKSSSTTSTTTVQVLVLSFAFHSQPILVYFIPIICKQEVKVCYDTT